MNSKEKIFNKSLIEEAGRQVNCEYAENAIPLVKSPFLVPPVDTHPDTLLFCDNGKLFAGLVFGHPDI